MEVRAKKRGLIEKMGNFDFLKSKFPILYKFGSNAESYLYSDSNSCLMKLGMMGETIVNLIFRYDRIPFPSDNSAAKRIDALLCNDLLNGDQANILHALRKARNKAVHENYESVSDGKKLMEMAHSICQWFMEVYGDWKYKWQPFVLPPEQQEKPEPEPVDKAAEEQREQEMVEEAEKAAADAPEVPIEKRRQQAGKVAGQHKKSEAETRYLIDEQLRQVGWEADTETLRYSKGTRPVKGRNLAIAEWPTDSTVGNSGRADYALFVGECLVGIVEAKADHKDIPSVLDYQGKDYPRNIRAEDSSYVISTWGDYKVPFTFATNGRPYLEQYKTKSGIWFLDLRSPANIPRALRGWMSPLGMMELLKQDIQSANQALENMDFDLLRDPDGLNLREYQIRAVQAAEDAVIGGAHTALLAMATGTGKTRTVLGIMYRFLKTDRFKRILFLVDRTALGEQAQDVFREVRLEDLLTLENIYDIKGLGKKSIDPETRIHVSTVQGMIRRILYNDGGPKPAVTDYDLVIVDEAHRGYILDQEMGDSELLYRDQRDYQSKYRSVIEYFDAVKIALTATPALQTTQIFGPPVFQYTYREAVIEGYLVDHDAPHNLHTRLRDEGIHYRPGDKVTTYDPVTGEITNGAELEDELDFDVEQFNRQVITQPFNEVVLKEIAKYIDPENPEEQGKTLIFAVSDSHADMIVDILRNIYSASGVNNDAIMKITGSVGGGNPLKVREAIKHFKNERFPSIAVTVDLLTTGIDVPEITSLVFLRRVKSRILFEQMMGRATRLCPKIHKTHFEIYDPVGIYESLAPVNSMKPVVVNPSTTYSQLLQGLEVMEEKEQVSFQIDQIIAKLQRQKRQMDDYAVDQFRSLSGGLDPTQYIEKLENMTVPEAKEYLLSSQPLFEFLQNPPRKGPPPVIISDIPDELTGHTRGYGAGSPPKDYLNDFTEYIRTHINEIAALEIICTRPRELTRQSLRDLRLTLDREGFTTQQLNTAISELTNEEMAADIISLIRRYAIGSTLISHEERIHRAVDRLKKAHKFTKQELTWIGRMEKYLLEESVLNISVFEEDSRFKNKGGFQKINGIFGDTLESVVQELNEYLYDDGGRTA